MAVMAVDAPCLKHPFHVSVVTRPAHVVHDFIPAPLEDQLSNLRRDLVQNLIPTDPLPLSFTPFTRTFQGIQDAFGVLDLVDSRGSLGAIAATAGRMVGIPFHAPNRPILLVDEGKKPASCFTIEA